MVRGAGGCKNEVDDYDAAEVDTPGFQFNQREGQRVEQAGVVEDSEESVYSVDTDDVLDAFYSPAEGVESRRKVAEWAAGGWQQPRTGAATCKSSVVRWRAQGRSRACWGSCSLAAG